MQRDNKLYKELLSLSFPRFSGLSFRNVLLHFKYIINTFFKQARGRKFKLHKTFRRGVGRLVNVLCTFNLRSVSAGKEVKFLQT